MKRLSFSLVVICAALALAACDDPGDATPKVTPLPAETPNAFLRYLNTQASLAAGDYTIVAATAVGGVAENFTLTITRDDGSVQTASGHWTSSGGMNPADSGNKSYALQMTRPGGVKIQLASSSDNYLYLMRDGRVVAEDDNSGPGNNALIDMPLSRISSVAYAQAYYKAVDPNDERATLQGFLEKNCFVAGNPACAGETVGVQTHVVFRDKKDLGYGRNMHARQNTDGSMAFYVDNYVIRLQPGSSSNYGPINVEAAVREDRDYHVGTNAIEFSPNPQDPAEMITKFYTFNPAGQRITSADLDGRGVKHMPQMCWVCHGGRLFPLDSNGDFPLVSLRSAKYNILEVDSFEYSALPGWSRARQEAGFKALNTMVRDSYVDMQARDDNERMKWYADFGIELAENRYGGAAMASDTYLTDYIPLGWQQNVSRPEGVARLYKEVIEPHCIACHSLQGNNAGSSSFMPAINFSSWEKFYSYRTIVADYVFRRGAMPLSLRNWEDFWHEPEGKPALLASFLDDPTLFDADHHVIRPGKPVARPGSDRTTPSPAQLDGTASSFAATYAWSIVSAPVSAVAGLDDATSARPVLTADTDGDYTLRLTVANPLGSDAHDFTVTIDSAAPLPSTLTFVDNIAPILGSLTGANCSGCHYDTGVAGIPVFWYAPDNPDVYVDVMARVNLADPENSLILMKPTGERHGGGVQIDLDTVDGRAKYNTILEWIRAGAPCGYDITATISCNY